RRRGEEGHPLRRGRRGVRPPRRRLHVRDPGQALRDQGSPRAADRGDRPRGGPARRQVHAPRGDRRGPRRPRPRARHRRRPRAARAGHRALRRAPSGAQADDVGPAMILTYLGAMRPYFRQVAGQLTLGSIAGIVMNTTVVLPAILLGRAIDRALALERGQATAADVGWAALLFIGGPFLTELPRMVKRWWLMTANQRIRANVRADAFRGVLGWPMADLQRTPVGDLMARIVGDVEVLGVGVREFTIETWDTLLFSLSFV